MVYSSRGFLIVFIDFLIWHEEPDNTPTLPGPISGPGRGSILFSFTFSW